MKIVFRTLVILAAALVVVGGLGALRQTSLGQSLASAGPAAGHERGAPPADLAAGAAPSGHEGQGASLGGLVSVGKSLATVAVSVVLVALGARLIQLGRRERPRPTPPEPL